MKKYPKIVACWMIQNLGNKKIWESKICRGILDVSALFYSKDIVIVKVGRSQNLWGLNVNTKETNKIHQLIGELGMRSPRDPSALLVTYFTANCVAVRLHNSEATFLPQCTWESPTVSWLTILCSFFYDDSYTQLVLGLHWILCH